MWAYHWGAQTKHPDPLGNFPRITPVAFNRDFASTDYYRYIETTDERGLIPVQAGRCLTLGRKVTAAIKNGNPASPDCIADGCAFASAPSYRKGSATAVGTPYMLTIDMEKPAAIAEITLATKLVNGSEGAYRYAIEASADNRHYTRIVDGTQNFLTGYQILTPTDTVTPYRYLRLRVYGLTNVNTGASAMWADGILELAAFGN